LGDRAEGKTELAPDLPGARRPRGTLPRMEGGSSGEENSNLYVRGVEEGRRGEQPDPSSLIELLDVFGERGLRSYLVGFVEGREDAREG
jgi:hypothetical protein